MLNNLTKGEYTLTCRLAWIGPKQGLSSRLILKSTVHYWNDDAPEMVPKRRLLPEMTEPMDGT